MISSGNLLALVQRSCFRVRSYFYCKHKLKATVSVCKQNCLGTGKVSTLLIIFIPGSVRIEVVRCKMPRLGCLAAAAWHLQCLII